jgi:hypothetical protein
MTPVNVVDCSGQFPETVSLGSQWWMFIGNLSTRRLACKIFEEDCRATVLPLPSAYKKPSR